MNEGLISKRYAKALFEYAVVRGEDKLLYERMRMLSRSILTVPRLRETLVNPMLKYADKEALVISAAVGEGQAEESYINFVRLVLNNRRENLFQNIALGYMEIFRRAHRINVITLTSVEPMPEYVLQRIKADVERRTRGFVELETHIDPSIEGGFIFQIDDLRLDASLKGQIDRIKQQFLRKNKIIV